MSKKQKTFRPKARLPRGLHDEKAFEVVAQRQMLEQIRQVYELYGFEPLETSALEYADVLGKFLPDQDRPNEGVFSFQDDDDQWLSLRYDLTAPLARYVAQNYDGLAKPFRRYQVGPVWRNEKPGPGRYRQFIQFDADTVAAPGMSADAELCAMLSDAMEALGIPRGSYEVRVNNRKILDGVFEQIGIALDDPDTNNQRLTALRAIDKLDRLGVNGVRALLGKGRKDESGDFTKGAELSEDQIEKVMSFVSVTAEARLDVCNALDDIVAGNETGKSGVTELREIDALLTAGGYGSDQIRFDPSIVRGLEYYTGPVYEVELTFETTDEGGEVSRFGSVGSGGRYDGLVERFKGVRIPATGCSIGVSRLFAALQALGKVDDQALRGPVVVLVMDQARVSEYQKMVQELRQAGIRSELYLGGSGMKAQMKYADKRQAPIVVIEGEDELANDTVTLKDLALGAKLSGEISDNKEWRESQATQVSVPRSDLVSRAQSMLDDDEVGE